MVLESEVAGMVMCARCRANLQPSCRWQYARTRHRSAHLQVLVMDVATIRSRVSFSTVYLSCRKPSYPD